MMLLSRTLLKFSKLTKQKIKQSNNYQSLVDLICKQYDYRQYKNSSALCLLQLHHQYKIFNLGDWVLDIGAGPDWGWTDLALKLTKNQEMLHHVISNDLCEMPNKRINHTFIRGDIQSQVTQTNIGLLLTQRRLNTILCDVSPQFTNILAKDSERLSFTLSSILQFSHIFLEPGGTFVFKMLQSDNQKGLNQYLNMTFNNVYRYVPSIIRATSPVCYYVAKGFLMNQSYEAVQKFIQQYYQSNNNKTKIIEKYHGKYKFNPKQIVEKIAKEEIAQLKMSNISDKQILKKFQNDPYSKVQEILGLYRQMQSNDLNIIQKLRVKEKLTGVQIINENIPSTQAQFVDNILKDAKKINKIQKIRNKDRKIKVQDIDIEEKQKVSRQPLKQDQIYIKSTIQKSEKKIPKIYILDDLIDPSAVSPDSVEIDLNSQKLQKIYNTTQQKLKNLEGNQKQIFAEFQRKEFIRDILKQTKKPDNKHLTESQIQEFIQSRQQGYQENDADNQIEKQQYMKSDYIRKQNRDQNKRKNHKTQNRKWK